MQTQIAAGRVFDFSHAVGRSAVSGMGFTHPVAVATSGADTAYVVSRGWEMVPNVGWNRTGKGTRISKVILGKVSGEEELINEFSTYGDSPGEVIWPAGVAVDNEGKIYVTDEWLNRISVFDADGNFLNSWGSSGNDDGEFNGPSGIAIDSQDDVYIVDSRNHRVQKVAKDGSPLAAWGGFGNGEGEFDSPWGIASDSHGYVYVADHKNHRVQKFTAAGEFAA